MKIILAILVIWTIISLIFYWTMFNKTVRKTPQNIVMCLLSGPIVILFIPIIWLLFIPIILTIDFFTEKIFDPLYKWLKK